VIGEVQHIREPNAHDFVCLLIGDHIDAVDDSSVANNVGIKVAKSLLVLRPPPRKFAQDLRLWTKFPLPGGIFEFVRQHAVQGRNVTLLEGFQPVLFELESRVLCELVGTSAGNGSRSGSTDKPKTQN